LAAITAASPEPVKLGSRIHYVATAIDRMTGLTRAPGMVSSTGSASSDEAYTLRGHFEREAAPSQSFMIPTELTFRLIEALNQDGWTVNRSPLEPKEPTATTTFALTTGRAEETIEFFLVIFHPKDGTLRISFTQRMSKSKI